MCCCDHWVAAKHKCMLLRLLLAAVHEHAGEEMDSRRT